MLAGPVPRTWRKYLRFSMRGLIVLVLVIAAGLGWVVRSARIQREAVVAIIGVGGLVRYDWEGSIANGSPAAQSWAPRWIVDLIGFDYFGQVTAVVLSPSSKATDAAIVQVGRLSHLKLLKLNGSSLSDAGLAHLKGLTNLSVLDLSDMHVSDAGLAYLNRLTKLSELDLGDTQVTDVGLAHLNGLTNLFDVNLGGTQVTDAGLAHLKGLTNLSVLRLNGTQVSDAGLAHLKGLTKLSFLRVSDTLVTGAGMKELKQALPSLTIYD
jgi:internalin A